jgi:hypothetical protein
MRTDSGLNDSPDLSTGVFQYLDGGGQEIEMKKRIMLRIKTHYRNKIRFYK